ncbi:hypothetical protein [Actinoplanes siamensis]|uniref:Uncharacterized protein n=1 Tax=Actinoplanes siamensis TaxID=1223317 RepID=A0A919NCM6_9ACTN|nr:hypothetical protein [Actinoplanes siamensis]GIF08279.1 hypothetical protein Asi03nite_58170 [Actinoplanes siamensis]
MRVASIRSYDLRFRASRALDGSDAMNPDPDHSAAYPVPRADDGSEGHGFTLTAGRRNELCRAAPALLSRYAYPEGAARR